MFCQDIWYIIGSYLIDVISLRNVNTITRLCKFNIILSTSRLNKNIYDNYNIVKICSTFTDYTHIDKLFTDSLLHLSLSYKSKNNSNIIHALPKLVNLRTLRLISHNFNDNTFINMTKLECLDIGYYKSDCFCGKNLYMLPLTLLNLGDTFIESKHINNMITLKHLYINTRINIDDFNKLINLQTLDVSNSSYTLGDSNISNLVNLENIRCKYSAISSISHLVKLDSLHLGVNYILKSIVHPTLKILSIIDSFVNIIDVPNLIEITLNNSITDDMLKIHTNIIYLYFGINTIITDNGINTLCNVTYLHCNYNRNITCKSLCNLHKLSYLHVGLSYIKLDFLENHYLQYVEQYDPYLGNLESIILLDNRHLK